MKLVIVESPTKAKTISKYLGKDFQVESSFGHVRDLPKSKLGIDEEHDFEPQYIIPRKAQPRVTALTKAAAKSDGVILATDADREGEAIAWHLLHALGLGGTPQKAVKSETGIARQKKLAEKPIERIVFHEITESAIKDALAHARSINMDLVSAQQGRRVLDRIVGYKLSPFLWKKIARGLSAGRVQSAALRLITDREKEIQAFKPEEYWTIDAELEHGKGTLTAALVAIDGKDLEKFSIPAKEAADGLTASLKNASYRVAAVEKKEARRNPLAPFTTSTLQQTAAQRFGMSAKKTMYLAQQLYENGHITYMRTDSVNISKDALGAAAAWIQKNLGEKYAADAPRAFTTKSRMAQEAHEAIRPTSAGATPDSMKLDKDEARLYDLIWRRFIASQLPPAVFDAVRIDVEAKDGSREYRLSASGSMMKFDGFLKIWNAKFEERELPALAEGDALTLKDILPAQHFTEPPPRYSEATLVKTLEKFGIGRPSTYAPIISVLMARNYVEKQAGRFVPTEIGTLVSTVLIENFPEIVDIDFTAKMEGELDDVAEGKEPWQKVIKDFYGPFSEHLKEKYESVKKEEIITETTTEVCEKCGKPMAVKFGRFGKFLACTGFPDCKNTKTLKDPPKSSGVKCLKCLDSDRKDDPGELLERRVRKGRARGKLFWGCSKYPKCDFAVWEDPTKVPPVYPPPEKEEKQKRGGRKKKEESAEAEKEKAPDSA